MSKKKKKKVTKARVIPTRTHVMAEPIPPLCRVPVGSLQPNPFMPMVDNEEFIQGVLAVRDPWTWARDTLFEEPDQHGELNPATATEIVDKVGSLVYLGANANREKMKWDSAMIFPEYLKRAVRDHASIELLADAKDPRTGLKFKSLIQPCVWIRMEAKGGDRELAVQLANAVLVLEYCPCVHSPKIAKAILDEIWSVPRMIAGRGKTSTHRAGP